MSLGAARTHQAGTFDLVLTELFDLANERTEGRRKGMVTSGNLEDRMWSHLICLAVFVGRGESGVSVLIAGEGDISVM